MPEHIDSCATCWYSRITSRDQFCCCFNAPLAGNITANFAPVSPTDWCGHWSQTGQATNIVSQVSIQTTQNSTSATLSNTDNLITDHYYGIISNKTVSQQGALIIPKNTIFIFSNSPNIILSQPALATDNSIPATITDQAFA